MNTDAQNRTLLPRQMRTIRLVAEGLTHREVANLQGCRREAVTRLVNSERGQTALNTLMYEAQAELVERLPGLVRKALNAIESVLDLSYTNKDKLATAFSILQLAAQLQLKDGAGHGLDSAADTAGSAKELSPVIDVKPDVQPGGELAEPAREKASKAGALGPPTSDEIKAALLKAQALILKAEAVMGRAKG